jgi:hypothetical protein
LIANNSTLISVKSFAKGTEYQVILMVGVKIPLHDLAVVGSNSIALGVAGRKKKKKKQNLA